MPARMDVFKRPAKPTMIGDPQMRLTQHCGSVSVLVAGACAIETRKLTMNVVVPCEIDLHVVVAQIPFDVYDKGTDIQRRRTYML